MSIKTRSSLRLNGDSNNVLIFVIKVKELLNRHIKSRNNLD